MNATKLIERVVQQSLRRSNPRHPEVQFRQAARRIVEILLDQDSVAGSALGEASVHRPQRSLVWQAALTGHEGGQTWRSRGVKNKAQALRMALRDRRPRQRS